MYSLGARVSSSWSASGIVTLVGAMTLFPAMETESFFDTSRSFCGGQFGERDSVNVHGIGFMGSSRGMNSGGELSSLQGKDAHLLGMEYLGLFDPFCESDGDRRHGENHSGELLV